MLEGENKLVRELATLSATMQQHLDHDTERFGAVARQLDAIGVKLDSIAKTVNDRFWTMAMSSIGVLITVAGTLIIGIVTLFLARTPGAAP